MTDTQCDVVHVFEGEVVRCVRRVGHDGQHTSHDQHDDTNHTYIW